ncbi:MAG: hypothetical protein AB8H79_26020 [Myxococcota bacterium]
MLRFTQAGVVASPTTVQIRLTRSLPGRLPAGAPEPTRDLSIDEVRENLHYFVEELKGPRTRPVSTAVLSGVSLGQVHGLAGVMISAKKNGIRRFVLHFSGEAAGANSALLTSADAVSMVVRHPEDVPTLRTVRHRVSALSVVVPVDHNTLSHLADLTRSICEAAPDRVVFTWPLSGDPPPHAHLARQALEGAVAVARATPVRLNVKGLPACALGSLASLASRTANRWYVDAEHQKAEAMLFFPDMMRFARGDVCRFCSVQGDCDGAPAAWLQQGLVGPLQALDHLPPSA